MSDTKFTPGPWVSGWNGGKTGPTTPSGEETCGGMEVIPVGYGTETVAIVISQDGISRGGDSSANAHLVSAAPDMYEALEYIISEIGNMNSDGEYVISIGQDGLDDIEQALKKARGEV